MKVPSLPHVVALLLTLSILPSLAETPKKIGQSRRARRTQGRAGHTGTLMAG